jgi:hypothetical protein
MSARSLTKYRHAELGTPEHGLLGDPDPVVPSWDYRKAQRDQKKAMESFTVRSQARNKPN